MASIRETVDREVITALVGKLITCQRTGEVLDVRTCVVFRDVDGDPSYVMSQRGYAELNTDTLVKLAVAGYVVDENTVKGAWT